MSSHTPPETDLTMRKALLVTVAMITTPAFSQGATYEKNGLPCVAEICLGDGIPELSKVKWDRSKNPFSSPQKPLYTSAKKVTDGEKRLLASRFKGDTAGALPFLADSLFDSTALAGLARVTAACERHELIGTYTTESGLPTRVGISLIPGQSDTSTQHWTVTSIIRYFPAAVTNAQKTELESQLGERYRAFDITKTKNAKPGEGRYSKNFGPSFGFNLLLFRGIEEGNRLKMHTACGGSSKIAID
ncbi:MAG: hypothetical protein QM788_05880 [Roseateles sp.]